MGEPLAWAVYAADDEDELKDDEGMSVDYLVFPDEDKARDWAQRTFEEDPKRPVVALYDSAALAAELERVRAELAFEKAQAAKTVRALNLDIAEKEAKRVGLLKLMEDVAFELEASSVDTTETRRVGIVAAQAKRLREAIHAALGPAGEGVPVEMVNRAIPQQTLAVLALIAKKEAELDELRARVEERQATRDDAQPPGEAKEARET
jgi:hypothetical protein